MEIEVAREIQAAVQDQLARGGVSGRVVITGDTVELRGEGAPVAVELHYLGEQWGLLPPEHRDRKVLEVAHRLGEAASARPGQGERSSLASRIPVRLVLYLAGIVTGALLLAFVWSQFGGDLGLREAEVAPPPKIPDETEQERGARQARVCDAARRRLFSGASIGPLDTEGWVVELWLVPSAETGDLFQAATALVTDDGRLSPDIDPELAELGRGKVEVAGGLATAGGGEVGTRLRFTGSFAAVFLDPERQPSFVRVADRIYERTSPLMAALYARCAHRSNHDVGAWFRARDPGLAASAVVFAIGGFADPQPVAPLATDLERVVESTKSLGVSLLTSTARNEGGDVVESEQGVTIRFPVAAGIRPIALGRALADQAKLAP